MHNKFLSLGAATALGLSAISGVATAAHPDAVYKAELNSLNNSGVTGTATVAIDENILTVVIRATGGVPDSQHAQHIHGKDNPGEENSASGSINASCPNLTADSDGDNIISIPEGADAYGGVLLLLNNDGTADGNFPTSDADGNIVFSATYTLGLGAAAGENGLPSTAGLLRLGDRHIVIHSPDAQATPAACGQLVEQ